ncbi:alpha/beta-Hydrolases superfamily protein [Zea mays]|uniref:Alpha/beta-Hydrolases superfamily protein n=1 Tax=Zea mays TaxID=4577 RepID=A0A1D6J002_MAIZE|nr:alpha/beta-Hydrolases superfamily protein [Zea mays]
MFLDRLLPVEISEMAPISCPLQRSSQAAGFKNLTFLCSTPREIFTQSLVLGADSIPGNNQVKVPQIRCDCTKSQNASATYLFDRWEPSSIHLSQESSSRRAEGRGEDRRGRPLPSSPHCRLSMSERCLRCRRGARCPVSRRGSPSSRRSRRRTPSGRTRPRAASSPPACRGTTPWTSCSSTPAGGTRWWPSTSGTPARASPCSTRTATLPTSASCTTSLCSSRSISRST